MSWVRGTDAVSAVQDEEKLTPEEIAWLAAVKAKKTADISAKKASASASAAQGTVPADDPGYALLAQQGSGNIAVDGVQATAADNSASWDENENELKRRLDELTVQLKKAQKENTTAEMRSKNANSMYDQPQGIVGWSEEQYANAQARAFDAAKANTLVNDLNEQIQAIQNQLYVIDYYKYSSCLNDKDFAKYSQMGAALKNPSFEEVENTGATLFGIDIGTKSVPNIVTYSRDNAGKINAKNFSGDSNGTGGARQGNTKYTYMTDEEVAIYNYYLGYGDTKTAGKYLEFLENDLNYRIGQQIADNIANDDSKLGRMVSYGGLAPLSGMQRFFLDVEQLFRNERMPTNYLQYASQAAREDLSGIGGTVYDAMNMLGYASPAIMAGMVAGELSPFLGKISGSTAYGLSSAGSAYGQALDMGYSPGRARAYGISKGGLDGFSQYLIGGIPAIGGKQTDKILTELTSKLNSPAMRSALRLFGRGHGAGVENVLQELGAWKLKEAFFGTEYEPTPEEMLNAYVSAALMSVAANAPGEAAKVTGEYKAKAKSAPPETAAAKPKEQPYGDWADDETPDGKTHFDAGDVETDEVPVENDGEVHKTGSVAVAEKGETENGSTIDENRLYSPEPDDINADIYQSMPFFEGELIDDELMQRLEASGVKYSKDKVLMTAKKPNGDLQWLEVGNNNAGMIHTELRHGADLRRKGIPTDKIPNFMKYIIQELDPYKVGTNDAGPYADYYVNGDIYRLSHGTNGFIVTLYPNSSNKK